MNPRFSVIIPTRKITAFLKECIEQLHKLDYQNAEFIIVTDSKENVDFLGDSRFSLIDSNGNGNPSLKRNIGAEKATGEILAFLDDDAYPHKDWLNEAAKIFNEKETYALGGPAMTPLNAAFLEQVSGQILKSWLASGGTIYRHSPQAEREIDDYPSVNLFVKKDAFDAVGGFGLDFWPGEDTKLCLDLMNYYKKKFLYSPNPVVYHHRREDYKSHLKQVSRYGQHRGQYARIFPENSRVFSYFVPSLFVLGLAFGWLSTFVFRPAFDLYLSIVGLYSLLVVVESLKSSIETKSVKMFFYVGLGIILTHIVYGFNFIVGFINKPKLKLKSVDLRTGNYAEG